MTTPTASITCMEYSKDQNVQINQNSLSSNNKKVKDQSSNEFLKLDKNQNEKKSKIYSYWQDRSCIAFIALVVVTYFSVGINFNDNNLIRVWSYGWITALSTGLGALPFLFIRHFNKFWLGICNGLAAGMMLSAAFYLIQEGLSVSFPIEGGISVTIHVLCGAIIGGVFVYESKCVLDNCDDITLGSIEGTDARKALLIIAVMALHSFTEGVGIGVSFGGDGGIQRGQLISTALAVHNIPEGLAISLVLIPRGLSVSYAALWSIFSSLPQPLMAVPAFYLIEQFYIFLPCGLGFAGGAMIYVSCCDLIVESLEDTNSKLLTSLAVVSSGLFMLIMQFMCL